MLNEQNQTNKNVKGTKLEITIVIKCIDEENLMVLVGTESNEAAGKTWTLFNMYKISCCADKILWRLIYKNVN